MPTLSNFNPTIDSVEISVDTNISFDITDSVSGIDISKLNVFVNDIPAVVNGIIEQQFNGTSAEITGITDGYTVILDPLVDFGFNETEEIIIDGYSNAGDNVNFNYTFATITKPRVLSATNEPFNTNVTVIFSENMESSSAIITPSNYLVSDGAVVTSVKFDSSIPDRVILTVDNLFNKSEFDVFVSGDLKDTLGTNLDVNFNHAIVRLEETSATISGVAGGRLKTKNKILKLYEDDDNWYVATEGGIDVINKLSLQNIGFILDGYGYSSISSNNNFVYFGNNDGYEEDAYGIRKVSFNDLKGDSTSKAVNAFGTNSAPSILSNAINDLFALTTDIELLAVATTMGASIIKDENTSVSYSMGQDITSIHLDDTGDILYLANSTMGRVEVYYGITTNTFDRAIPDAYYGVNTSPEITNSIINQIKITNNTSIIDSDSNTIYVATDNGLTKIETDESIPGNSESEGVSFSYGIEGSGAIFEILGGEVNRVVAVDINLQIQQIFVATSDLFQDGGLTTINRIGNNQFSFIDRNNSLIHSDIRDIVFKNL